MTFITDIWSIWKDFSKETHKHKIPTQKVFCGSQEVANLLGGGDVVRQLRVVEGAPGVVHHGPVHLQPKNMRE